MMCRLSSFVIPMKAGIHAMFSWQSGESWMPTCVGITGLRR